MGIRLRMAQISSSILTWGLRNIARRPAANTPGLVALKIDPNAIAELRGRMHKGCIMTVGTNGKTTVNNLIASVLEASGHTIICNRTGANLNSGITSALLQSKGAEWGVLECDELWSAKIVPQIKPTYFLLLDLFRDQLDRCGEIDHIQDAIVSGLKGSPDTTLIYNADDPLCQMVADRLNDGRKLIAFGTAESMGLVQNRVADASMCQKCLHMFHYDFRQYGQLGSYTCPNCGFTRATLDFEAFDIRLGSHDLSFMVREVNSHAASSAQGNASSAGTADVSSVSGTSDTSGASTKEPNSRAPFAIETKMNGTYMVYNLLAVSAAALTIGCPVDRIQETIKAFDPKNGRLQEYDIDGRHVLLNLAKNPTGFNQNLRIVAANDGPKAVAFFINDNVVDGHDISWIWDIDFEELAQQQDLLVFAGGTRKNDLQVRLKYAGVNAHLVDGVDEVFAATSSSDLPKDAPIYAIANYTALPPVKASLDAMQSNQTKCTDDEGPGLDTEHQLSTRVTKVSAETPQQEGAPVVIAHVLPDLLNLYGDGGNVRVLEQRLNWRGIPVEVRKMSYADPISFDDVDLVVLGGSPDREQRLALHRLQEVNNDLAHYVEDGGPLLAICGGYQMLGRTWVLDGEEVDGLSVLPMDTRRANGSTDRLIDNIALSSEVASRPVIGYENHSGRTYLDDDAVPFGQVISHTGHGNNDQPGVHSDGIIYKNTIGTYLHGPLLSKNPEVADWLLERAIDRHATRTGSAEIELGMLDDAQELAANQFMAHKLT